MAFTVAFTQSYLLLGPTLTGLNSAPSSAVNPNLQVTVYPQWFTQVSLDWTIPPDWGVCTYNVYSRLGPEDEWQRLTSSPLHNPQFTDPTNRQTSKYASTYYVVEAMLTNGTSFRSAPTTWKLNRRNKVEFIASEIQRREYMLLTKFVGVKSFLYRRRYYGLRCPRCWSSTVEKVVDDHCPVCIGTSFQGGYFDPIPLFVQYETTPNNRSLTYFGKLEANQIGGWTISVPEINDEDIIIRSGDWSVYRVIVVTPTELLTNTVRQMLTLTQLGRGDIENTLLTREVSDDFGAYLAELGGDYSLQRFNRGFVTGNPQDDPPWEPSPLADVPLKYIVPDQV